MSDTTRLISTATLFFAVILATIALFVLDNRDLARILFAAVIIIGYGSILVRFVRRRAQR